MRHVESTDPAPDQVEQVPVRRGRAGGLLRRTFIIALVLVSGWLITSSVVELFFRYRESVEGIWRLQREMARGAAFEIQQFVRDIERTLWAATQTPDIVAAGLTESERFQLDKLLKVTPAITTAVALDATGREWLKVSRRRIVQPEDLTESLPGCSLCTRPWGDNVLQPGILWAGGRAVYAPGGAHRALPWRCGRRPEC